MRQHVGDFIDNRAAVGIVERTISLRMGSNIPAPLLPGDMQRRKLLITPIFRAIHLQIAALTRCQEAPLRACHNCDIPARTVAGIIPC